MPTSSQALILINTNCGKWSSLYKKRVSVNFIPFPLSIITLSGEGSCKPKSSSLPGFMVTNDDDSLKSKTSLPGFMVSSDDVSLKDYRGTLSFENETKYFQWKLIPLSPDTPMSGTADGRRRKSSESFQSSDDDDVDDYDVDDDDTLVLASNFDDSISVDDVYNPNTNDSYQRLLDLGFNTSSFPDIQKMHTSFPDIPKKDSHESRKFIIRNRSGYSSKLMFSSTPSVRSKLLPFLNRQMKRYHLSQKTGSSLQQDITAPRRQFSADLPLPPIGKKLSHRSLRKIASTAKGRLLSKLEAKTLQQTEPYSTTTSTTTTTTKRNKTTLSLPHVRMRSQLPPPSPQTLCFFLINNINFCHKEIKNIIESQSNTLIKSLKFDPVFVHLGIENTNDVCLWVFTLAEDSMCMRLLIQGLDFDSMHVRVRRYDDVLRDEHNAYCLYRSVMEDIERRKLVVKRRPWQLHQNKNEQRHEANRHIAFTGVI